MQNLRFFVQLNFGNNSNRKITNWISAKNNLFLINDFYKLDLKCGFYKAALTRYRSKLTRHFAKNAARLKRLND